MTLPLNLKILLTALGLGITVIVALSSILGGLFVWGLWVALAVLLIGGGATIGKLIVATRTLRRIPPQLTPAGFSYKTPDWLTEADREKLSDLAKAAFVLLLFEQTESGCWSKSYLSHLITRGEKLPLARGALTGTPFALLAISSYAGKEEEIVRESTYHLLFETLAKLLRDDGTYLKRYGPSFVGEDANEERPRHAAGACLIALMYGDVGPYNLKTIEWLCNKPIESTSYDWAVLSRLLLHARQIDSIPILLRAKANRRLKRLLLKLTHQPQTLTGAHIWANPSDLRHESINQWGTAWWILPALSAPDVSTSLKLALTDRLRQFLLAQAAAEPTGTKLLAAEIDESGNGRGQTVFGTGIALVAWSTLAHAVNNPDDGKVQQQATIMMNDETIIKQSRKIVERLINSSAEVIEFPTFIEKTKVLEGYLGWAAMCLGAASVGIQISHDDCSAAVLLTRELNKVEIDNCSESELESAYKHKIEQNKRLLNPKHVDHVARAAARVGFVYKAVKEQTKKTAAEEF